MLRQQKSGRITRYINLVELQGRPRFFQPTSRFPGKNHNTKFAIFMARSLRRPSPELKTKGELEPPSVSSANCSACLISSEPRRARRSRPVMLQMSKTTRETCLPKEGKFRTTDAAATLDETSESNREGNPD